LSDNRHVIDTTVNAVPEFLGKVAGPAPAAPAASAPPSGTSTYPQTPPGYADGGMVTGPGSGTSDSIPARLPGGRLGAVSNGEYVVPPKVVAALGADFFEHLLERLHNEAPGHASVPPPGAPEVGLQNGAFVVPADVVAALGRDFFDKLVETYGA
jgi:hypothetical protein